MINSGNFYVSIIIPTYHDWERLKICIKALYEQTYPQENFEVIIVNNDPEDSPPEFSLPDNYRIISEGRLGSYAARNAGIKQAKGEILAFTDSDCIPDESWIENGVNKFQSSSDIYRVGGKIELFFRSQKLSVAEIYEKAYSFHQDLYVKEKKAAATANMWTYKHIFDKVGLFNENLLSGGDMEWGRRAHDFGVPIVYEPEIVIKHPARGSIKELTRKAKRVAEGTQDRSELENKDSPVWLFRALMPPVFAIKAALEMSHLTTYEKVMAPMVLYYLKMYKAYCRVMAKFSQ